MLKRKGSILIVAYFVLIVLLILGGAFVSRIIAHKRVSDISRERTEAFYVAEAAVDKAMAELKTGFTTYTGTISPVSFGRGQYEIAVQAVDATHKKILADGYVPSKTGKRVERHVEANVKKEAATSPFFDNALYSAGDLEFEGNAYAVTGDVIYADEFDGVDNISGEIEHDSTVAPLAQFDFVTLRAIAVAQGNLYDTARLSQVQQNKDSYPADFWHDESAGEPNVVYIEGDMVVNGNFGTVGGFVLVVGNVLTDPDADPDATINGNGTVNGGIYALGEFKVNGGGSGGINVNGGVWAGEEINIKGNTTVSYNSTYMNAIKSYVETLTEGSFVVQVVSWREL